MMAWFGETVTLVTINAHCPSAASSRVGDHTTSVIVHFFTHTLPMCFL